VKSFKFEELRTSPLIIDAIYEGGTTKNLASEVIAKVLSAVDLDGKHIGVTNAGGFRYRGSLPSPLLVALTSDSSESAWPDWVNPFTGQLTYFGDNRAPGHLHETPRGGNRILAETFARHQISSEARASLPVFFYFTKWRSYSQQFRGLVVPGGIGVNRDDELNAIWRTRDGERFQNYRAIFTVLDVPEISRTWISDIVMGNDKLTNAPLAYVDWVETGRYKALVSENVIRVRTREQQLPTDPLGKQLVNHIHHRFAAKQSYEFEPVALALWTMLSKLPIDAHVTRKSADGGRDAYGVIHIGPTGDPLKLDFALEAKCYAVSNSVGVKETSRLISRLRRHHFGVLVTTSFVSGQAYEEIREDGHPVVLITGSDIAQVLIDNGYDTIKNLDAWIDSILDRKRIS
jgi:hypothetical protein